MNSIHEINKTTSKTYTMSYKKSLIYSVPLFAGLMSSGVDALAACTSYTLSASSQNYTLNNDECLTNTGSNNTLTNSGTVAISSGTAITNLNSLTAINNNGTITSLDSDIIYSSSGSIGTIRNTGSILAGQYQYGINSQGGQISALINIGTISGGSGDPSSGGQWGGDGIYNNSATIDVITNAGSILRGGISDTWGIRNGRFGTINTLNNAQGAGNSNGALTFNGYLPTNYNIIINSPSQYGQLTVSNPNGQTTFGIYAGGVAGVSASTVGVNGKYVAVLSGVSLSNLTSTSVTYAGMTGTLTLESGSSTIWDLCFGLCNNAPAGPSIADTQASLQNTVNHLQSTYALQNAAIANGLTYDCTVFNKSGICVSGGVRQSMVNVGDGGSRSAVLIGTYRVSDTLRIGAWLDQNVMSNSNGIRLNNSAPMYGLFGVWNADQSGHGTEVRFTAGYGETDMTVTRSIVGTSEAGSGSSKLTTSGVSATVSHNIPLSTAWTASPYAGVRRTLVRAASYSEATTSSVSAPLSYAVLSQESTTVVAGLKMMGQVTSAVGVYGIAGVEQDVSNAEGDYVATGVSGLTAIAINPTVRKTRSTGTVGVWYDIDKKQRISVRGVYRTEPFQSMRTFSVVAAYTVGF